MERVAIVGPGGAGKTTFARALGERTGLPVIHLDEHFWQPGWVPTDQDRWRVVQEDLLAGERWIADGNYGGTLDVRFRRADTVIVFAPSRLRCVVGVIRRWATSGGRAVQADGCPERVTLEFLRWVWRYPGHSRAKVDRALVEHGPRARVVEVRHRRTARRLLAEPMS
ncbi:MAG: hypothetical protein S0880_37600 [Actinomycetota bacterium]|nr:hypothetical protein [Actinomycetota bacterium]